MGVLNYKTIYNTSSPNNKEIRQRFYMSKLLNVSTRCIVLLIIISELLTLIQPIPLPANMPIEWIKSVHKLSWQLSSDYDHKSKKQTPAIGRNSLHAAYNTLLISCNTDPNLQGLCDACLTVLETFLEWHIIKNSTDYAAIYSKSCWMMDQ